MTIKISLQFLNSSLRDQTYTYDERTMVLIGRNDDCDIKLPKIEEFSQISRHHCLLNINPPEIRIRDLGSKNGTYINDQKIGQRPKYLTPEEAKKLPYVETELRDNDTIRIDNLLIQVSFVQELGGEQNSDPLASDPLLPSTFKLSGGQNGDGEMIAPPPRGNLMGFVKGWLKRLMQGDRPDPSLLPIQGYYVSKSIGKGAFGEVYLAIHNQTQKRVALKVMLPEMAQHQRQKELFLREVENTKALNHPNIVKLLDYGFSEGIFYFTLEYCDRGNLYQLCKQQPHPFTVKEALGLIIPVLDGLDHAHNVEIPYVKQRDGGLGKGVGLVHRDLNPNNILIMEQDGKLIPKVSDFGIAKAFDNAGLSGLSRSGEHLEGTLQFMSRTQILHFKYAQPALDVWAAAACLYYLLTFKYTREFSSGDPILTILQTKTIAIQRYNPDIPDRLAQVIDLALNDTGDLHFTNAIEFKQALLSAM
ncbi:MAG: protein kinase [Synechococcaceae cyanobacterium RL_1_2]|nr:protein kinase [Synechococcaceae cyanobacterium RL_1_2]